MINFIKLNMVNGFSRCQDWVCVYNIATTKLSSRNGFLNCNIDACFYNNGSFLFLDLIDFPFVTKPPPPHPVSTLCLIKINPANLKRKLNRKKKWIWTFDVHHIILFQLKLMKIHIYHGNLRSSEMVDFAPVKLPPLIRLGPKTWDCFQRVFETKGL